MIDGKDISGWRHRSASDVLSDILDQSRGLIEVLILSVGVGVMLISAMLIFLVLSL